MVKVELQRLTVLGGLASLIAFPVFLKGVEFSLHEFALLGIGIWIAARFALQPPKIFLVHKQLFILVELFCILFLAYILIRTLWGWGYAIHPGLKVLFKWAELFVISIFVFFYVDRLHRFSNIYWLLFSINLALIIQALIYAPFSEGLSTPPRIRIGYSTVFSIALLLPFATKWNLRIFLYFLFTVVIFSQARASWIGIAGVLSIFLYRVRGNFRLRKKIAISGLLIIAFILSIPSTRNIVFDRISQLGMFGGEPAPATLDRLFRLQCSFRTFLDYPIFGVGPGNILTHVKEIGWEEKLIYRRAQKKIFLVPHNLFAEYLAQFGLIGFMIFILMLRSFYKIISTMRRYNQGRFKYKPELIGIYLYFFALLMFLTFGYIAGTTRVMLGIYLGLILAMLKYPTFYPKKEKSKINLKFGKNT